MLSLVTKLAVLAAVATALPYGALTPRFVAQIKGAGRADRCVEVRDNVMQDGTPLEL